MRASDPNHPDEIVGRILIEARVIALRQLAARTAQTFADARRCTELTPAEIAAKMEEVLDRQRADEPPGT